MLALLRAPPLCARGPEAKPEASLVPTRLTYASSHMHRAGSCGAEAQAWAPEGGFGPQFVNFVQGLLQ